MTPGLLVLWFCLVIWVILVPLPEIVRRRAERLAPPPRTTISNTVFDCRSYPVRGDEPLHPIYRRSLGHVPKVYHMDIPSWAIPKARKIRGGFVVVRPPEPKGWTPEGTATSDPRRKVIPIPESGIVNLPAGTVSFHGAFKSAAFISKGRDTKIRTGAALDKAWED